MENKWSGKSETIWHLEAQYGPDVRNPLMWDLINVKHHLEKCQSLDKQSLLIGALIDWAEQMGRGSGHWHIRIGFFEKVARAISDGDANFFRKVAHLLESRVNGPPEHRWESAVKEAYQELTIWGLSETLPTKKQVTESAKRIYARQNVLEGLKRMGIDPDKKEQAKKRVNIDALVEKEIKVLPVQNWTNLLKQCQLEHLPESKRGRPPSKKRGNSQ